MRFRIFQIVTICQFKALDPYIIFYIIKHTYVTFDEYSALFVYWTLYHKYHRWTTANFHTQEHDLRIFINVGSKKIATKKSKKIVYCKAW